MTISILEIITRIILISLLVIQFILDKKSIEKKLDFIIKHVEGEGNDEVRDK